jgi:hypothetical protein
LRLPLSELGSARGEIALVTAITVIIVVIAVWFHSPARWVDAFLLMAVTVTLVLLVLAMLNAP